MKDRKEEISRQKWESEETHTNRKIYSTCHFRLLQPIKQPRADTSRLTTSLFVVKSLMSSVLHPLCFPCDLIAGNWPKLHLICHNEVVSSHFQPQTRSLLHGGASIVRWFHRKQDEAKRASVTSQRFRRSEKHTHGWTNDFNLSPSTGITSAAAAHHTVTYSMKNLPSAKWSESKNTWWVVQGWSTSKSNFRVSTQGFNLEPPAHYEIRILLAGSSQPGPAPNWSGPTGLSCRSGISFANTLAGICPHYVYTLVEPMVVQI